MKAIRIQSFNDDPSIKDVPVPDIAPDQVLVRVQAAALNPLDALVVSGVARHFFDIKLPITLATDFAGTIERVGSDVTQWKAGDRVVAWADAGTSGGLAEFAAIPAQACVALPASLSAAEGACIPTAGITAWHTLFSAAGLKTGETVLIHAGAGGVGSFAVQFAHKAGARVIATATGDGLALARSLGADEVIDYQTQDFTKLVSGVDVVLDLVGGDTQLRSFGVLRKEGRLVSTAMPPDEAVAKAHGVSASIFYAKPYANRLGELVTTIAAQGVKTVIDSDVSFESFTAAWTRLTSRQARGKIVVHVPPSTGSSTHGFGLQTATALGGIYTLAGTSLRLKRMGYGTMQLPGPHVWGPPRDKNAALAVLREVIAHGANHIDTAEFYGPHVSNQLIREALAPYPGDLTIVTKVGYVRGEGGSWMPDHTPEGLARAVRENLASLGLEALDVVNLRLGGPHGPDDRSVAEPLGALIELQRKGLVRHIGLSNVTHAQFTEAESMAKIVCVQNQYNLVQRGDDAFIDALAAKGVAYAPFFPLGGFSPLQSSVLSDVATALGATPMQVALAWLLQRSPNILVIAGTSSVSHLRENFKAADLVLSPEQVATLDGIAGRT